MKIVMIIALILVSGLIQAEESSCLEVEWAFQLGWIPFGALSFYTANYFGDFENSFDAQFTINAIIFNIFIIGGKNISYFKYSPDNTRMIFAPTGISYDVFFGIMPVEGISIIYYHSCSHPVETYFVNDGERNIFAGFDRVYFEIKGKLYF